MSRQRIAFQGEHGAFSEEAAFTYFGRSIKTIPLKTFADVFSSVEKGKTTAGIIPIENSLFGSVHQNYDLLQRHDLHIIGELKIRVVHALLARGGVRLRNIRYIYSHPQALGQCEKFLALMKRAEIVAMYDTAGAAKMISDDRREDAAAIASERAAKVYGLHVLKSGIESDHRNFTRFLVLSRTKKTAVKKAKTSIIFAMKNIPGALFKALSVFSLRDINLYKIESRPLVGKPWEYLFYLDFDGSIRDTTCNDAINHLREITTYLKILGSYTEGRAPQGLQR